MTWGEHDDAVAAAFAGAVPGSGWKRATCPVCADRTGKEDHRASLSLSTDTGKFKCWKCGVDGRLKDFDKGWEPKLPGETKQAGDAGVLAPDHFVPLWEPPGATAWSTAEARAYLERRGVGSEAIAGCRVGVCLEGYLQGRIVVPHGYSVQGRWGGWIARDYIGDKQLRYLYPKGMDRTRFWRQDELSVVTRAPVLLCEGVFDALPHYPHAAAFLGKPIGAHVAALSKHRGRPLAICLDGDAWEEAQMLAWTLAFQGVPEVAAVRMPPGQDPGELPSDLLLREARNALAAEDRHRRARNVTA